MKIKSSQFYECSVARADNGDGYSLSGYVIIQNPQDKNKFCLISISHCSCFGTWEGISGWPMSNEWDVAPEEQQDVLISDLEYTFDEMYQICSEKLDTELRRPIDPDDYDYDMLCKLYQEFVTWAIANKPKG